MTRRPLLPYRMTMMFAIVLGIFGWLGGAVLGGAMFGDGVASTVVGVVGALVGLLGLPYLLGWREQVPLLLLTAGVVVLVFGPLLRADDLGMGLALAVFVPIAVVFFVLTWLASRFVAPLSGGAQRR